MFCCEMGCCDIDEDREKRNFFFNCILFNLDDCSDGLFVFLLC